MVSVAMPQRCKLLLPVSSTIMLHAHWQLLAATEDAMVALTAKSEEIRVLRMMLDAAKLDAATKEKEKSMLKRRLKGAGLAVT